MCLLLLTISPNRDYYSGGYRCHPWGLTRWLSTWLGRKNSPIEFGSHWRIQARQSKDGEGRKT